MERRSQPFHPENKCWHVSMQADVHSPRGCAAPGRVPGQGNTPEHLSKLKVTSARRKIIVTCKSPVGDISAVTLIRTDTTLDHSQKAEKVCLYKRYSRLPARQIPTRKLSPKSTIFQLAVVGLSRASSSSCCSSSLQPPSPSCESMLLDARSTLVG